MIKIITYLDKSKGSAFMNSYLKKKLTTALITGCSVLAISSISFANPADNCGYDRYNCSPPAHHHMMANFENRPIPQDGYHSQFKAKYQEYYNQFQDKYSWIDRSSCKRMAMNFVSIDKALDDNKLSQTQADTLKKQLISFYKNREKYINEMENLDRYEAREYHQKHMHHMSLDANINQLAQDSNIPVATLEKVLRPHARDFNAPKPNFSPEEMQAKRDRFRHDFDRFTKELISEGKITQEESDALAKSMEKFSKMTPEEIASYHEKFKDMSPAQHLAELSKETGISTERLTEIFKSAHEKFASERNN